MVSTSSPGGWRSADGYEAYMGRWSRPMATRYLDWLNPPKGARWLDAGCGTGAVAAAVLETAEPVSVIGLDPSAEFVRIARQNTTDDRATFEIGDVCELRSWDSQFDLAVAGLVLNHVSEPALAVAEMARLTSAGGVVGAYLWDYSGEMQMVRLFWEAVWATEPNASKFDPRSSYQICQPDPLVDLFRTAGLNDVEVDSIDLSMLFRDFEDFWHPHTLIGPAAPQRYVAGLDEERRARLKDRLHDMLPIEANGEINLIGRAWAVQGMKAK